jgi:chromosome segregation ATPase
MSRVVFQLFVVLAVVVSLGLVQVDAQSRKKKRTRRTTTPVKRPVITNPTIALPGDTTDPKIISTADQTSPDVESTETPAKKPAKSAPDTDNMQQTITTLNNQVNRLNDRLTAMQEDDRYLLDMERLTRAEQRAESLRAQLIDVQSKMADLGSKLDQVEYYLKPENIDKATQGYGSTRPEDARDARRRQLENEKGRLQAQISILENSRVRLESAIATADSEVDLLRARLNQQRMDADAKKTEQPKATTPRKPE